MISVPNRPQPLNGNKAIIISILLLVFGSCSPKLIAVTAKPKTEPAKPLTAQNATASAPAKKKINRKKDSLRVSSIALLLPFGLDHLQPNLPYTNGSLKEADIAIDYYQGFKLALDSLTGKGYNFKLQVFDTRDEKSQAKNLAGNNDVISSNLIIGPVFPDGIKSFTGTIIDKNQAVVSPLSASSPVNYKSPGLITAIPPIEYHAVASAQYVNNKLKAKRVFLLKSGFSEENDYITPFNATIDSSSQKQIKVVPLTVIHGQLSSLYNQMSKTDQNVFLVPSTNEHFLNVTLRVLDSLSSTYPVTLIGHPSWANFSFLKSDMLQRLNTLITSSDQVNFKSDSTITFIKDYRDMYHTEPSAYSIKGFDEGMYFGKLLGTDSLKNIDQVDFKGLHNSFHFQKKEGFGWINTHVGMLKYDNFELKKVE